MGPAPWRETTASLLARQYYFELDASNGTSEARAALSQIVTTLPSLEPHFLERISAFSYDLFGAERISIPRLISTLAWLVAGLVLWLTLKKRFSLVGATVAVGVMYLLPFAVMFGRTFQPDSMMIMFWLTSLYFWMKVRDGGDYRLFLLAVVAGATAILIKPTVAPILLLVPAVMEMYQFGFRALINRKLLIYAVLILAPAAVFYGQNYFTGEYIGEHASENIQPGLWFDKDFWRRWMNMLSKSVGLGFLLAGLLGLVAVKKADQKALLASLWIGYMAYGMIFSWKTQTHVYYQLVLVPIISIGVGGLVQELPRLDRWRNRPTRRSLNWDAWSYGLIALVIVLIVVHQSYRGSFDQPEARDSVVGSKEIATLIGRDARAVVLSPWGARDFVYTTSIWSIAWAAVDDSEIENTLNYLIDSKDVNYFVITDRDLLADRFALATHISENYRSIPTTSKAIIYELVSE